MDNSTILYITKVSVAITMFYGIYMIFLRKDTFNHIKRLYLLFAISASLLLPMCNIGFIPFSDSMGTIEAFLPQIEIMPTAETADTTGTISNNTVNLFTTIYYILIAGVILFSFRLVIQLASIINIRISNNVRNDNGTNIVYMNENIAPFSFFDWIFIPKNIDEQQQKSTMIAHERIHAGQNHSFDILYCELFCIVFWWNPIAWLMKREIRINLEYLADEGVLREGFDPKNYQYLLLKITNPNASISIINNFNVSQLKNRIIMINKEKTRKLFTTKYLLTIPVVLFVLLINIACSEIASTDPPIQADTENTQDLDEITTSTNKKKEAYQSVEHMPKYPGGDTELLKYISENLKYPADAADNNIEGLVVVRFIIDETGDISDVEVLRSVSVDCDNEAIRVVKNMPKWQPGKHDGKDVAVYYTLPIRYKLQK